MYKSCIMVHYLSNYHHLQIMGSLFLWYFKKIFHCALIQYYSWAKVMYVQLCKNILFENIVYELCEDSWYCAYCDHSFHHTIPIWQESHCASNNCTVVLQADTGDRQQTLSDNFKVRHPVVFCYN